MIVSFEGSSIHRITHIHFRKLILDVPPVPDAPVQRLDFDDCSEGLGTASELEDQVFAGGA